MTVLSWAGISNIEHGILNEEEKRHCLVRARQAVQNQKAPRKSTDDKRVSWVHIRGAFLVADWRLRVPAENEKLNCL